MTAQEALNLLNNAVAFAALNRQDHVRVIQAVQVLQSAITPKPVKEEGPIVESKTTVPQAG